MCLFHTESWMKAAEFYGRSTNALRARQCTCFPLREKEDRNENRVRTARAPLFWMRVTDSREGFSPGEPNSRPMDEELFLACVRSGGARGMLSTAFTGNGLLGVGIRPTAVRSGRSWKSAGSFIWRRKACISPESVRCCPLIPVLT